jgi:calcyphosin
MVTFEEFENYYANISASIDNDDYFELMMRNAWHISGGLGAAANTTNTRALVTRSDGQQEVVNLQNDLGMKKKTDKSYKDELVRRLNAQGLSNIAGVSVSGSVACSSKDGSKRQSNLPPRSMQTPKHTSAAVDSKLPGLESTKRYQLTPPPWVSLEKNDAGHGKPSQIIKMAPPPWIHEEEVVSLDNPVIEKIRKGTLARGIKGIVELQRQCRKVEDGESGLLNIDEFKEAVKGLTMIGDVSTREITAAHAALSQGADTSLRSIKVSDMELENLFKILDTGDRGVIWTEFFIDTVRRVMPSSRQCIVDAAFQHLDQRWEKVLENHILIRNFEASNHPLVIAGAKTESEIRIEFLETFDFGRTIPGKVTKADFDNYHANLSATIEKDVDFENLMRAIWGLRNKSLQASRVMRPRERSPPPPERWNPSIAASNTHFRSENVPSSNECDNSSQISIASSTNSSISTRRHELLNKMPKISCISNTDAGKNTVSRTTKDCVEGLKLPTAFTEKNTNER